jgi:hypothetical protein
MATHLALPVFYLAIELPIRLWNSAAMEQWANWLLYPPLVGLVIACGFLSSQKAIAVQAGSIPISYHLIVFLLGSLAAPSFEHALFEHSLDVVGSLQNFWVIVLASAVCVLVLQELGYSLHRFYASRIEEAYR